MDIDDVVLRRHARPEDVAIRHNVAAEPDGSFTMLVGPSGCGKSTLLGMIAGLEEVSGGTIHIGGDDVTSRDPSQRGIAMVFQSYALYPHMSVADHIGFGLKPSGVPKAEIAARVGEAAETLQLSHLLDRKPKQLSGRHHRRRSQQAGR